MDKIIYYFHNIIYNTYLMERRFKSEREKIEYYKKLKVQENNIAQKNMDKITEAYHEIEFGVIPEVSDNRSLAEKIADERGQQRQAQKNTLMLMANDGGEADKLQNLIGAARYSEFNRHFLDIYNNLKNQVGHMGAQEAFQYIDRYITRTNLTQGVDIPNVEILTQLINEIRNIPTPNTPSSITVDMNDVVLRLEALTQVLGENKDAIDKVEYNSRNLPTKYDIAQLLNDLHSMNNATFADFVNELKKSTVSIDSNSLGNVIINAPVKPNEPAEPIEPSFSNEVDRLMTLGDLKIDAEQEENFERLKEVVAEIMKNPRQRIAYELPDQGSISDTDKINMYSNAYTYVLQNADAAEIDILKFKKNLRFLYKVNGLSTKSIDAMKDPEKLQSEFKANPVNFETFNNYALVKKSGDLPYNMLAKNDIEALQRIDNHLDTLQTQEKKKAFSDEYIRRLNALRGVIRFEDPGKRLDLNSSDAENYAFLASITRGINGKQAVKAKTYGGLKDINKSPYINIYAHLISMFGEPQKQAQPSTQTQPQAPTQAPGSNIHGMNDLVFNDGAKSGNGLKRFHQILKRRVY